MAQEYSNGSVLKLFGFELRRLKKDEQDQSKLPSMVPPVDEDGNNYAQGVGGHYGQFVNLEGNEAKDNAALIYQYRTIASHPEVDKAIDHIVSEAISSSEDESSVKLKMDDIKLSDGVKKKINDEFEHIVGLLKFNELGYDTFRKWYVEGRLYHHIVVEKGREKQGIQDIRPIDAAKIRKIKEIKYKKDPDTGAKVIDQIIEYFVYQEKPGSQTTGIKLTPDSVSYVSSGLMDPQKKKVVSPLHKALKPINQLRMMEDSLVIYRMSRAPERRIFYIDTGNLPTKKANEYVKSMMNLYRNKIVYDQTTGQIKDDRKHMNMLEDYWLPRREGGRGTEIDTLPGGENLGNIDDVIYFQRKMYNSLNIPITRLETEPSPFSMGRPSEITRDELMFQKFIDRLRMKFSSLFLGLLKKQLILKQIITQEDWEEIENDLVVNFIRDNYFAELKDIEIWRERLTSLDQIEPHVGVYFSREWVMKNVLRMDDDEIKQMRKEIDTEAEEQAKKEEEMGGGEDQPGEGQQFQLSVTPTQPEDQKS